MKTKLYDINGTIDGDIELDESVFNVEINDHLIYEAVKNELANERVGTAACKNRSMVSGSTIKLHRQKHTGRARAGSKKSPIRRGGGVAFGPQPRDYSYSIGKRKKRKAIKTVLSKQLLNGNIKVVKDFTVEDGKTKTSIAIFEKIRNTNKILFVMKDDDKMLKRSIRNIPYLKFLVADRLTCKDIFYAKELILLEGSLDKISNILNK